MSLLVENIASLTSSINEASGALDATLRCQPRRQPRRLSTHQTLRRMERDSPRTPDRRGSHLSRIKR